MTKPFIPKDIDRTRLLNFLKSMEKNPITPAASISTVALVRQYVEAGDFDVR